MKFGHSVTSIFVKNSQKRKKNFFCSSVNAEENGALVIAPFFWHFEKNETLREIWKKTLEIRSSQAQNSCWVGRNWLQRQGEPLGQALPSPGLIDKNPACTVHRRMTSRITIPMPCEKIANLDDAKGSQWLHNNKNPTYTRVWFQTPPEICLASRCLDFRLMLEHLTVLGKGRGVYNEIARIL